MASTIPVRNSDAESKDGIQKLGLEFLKQYDEPSIYHVIRAHDFTRLLSMGKSSRWRIRLRCSSP